MIAARRQQHRPAIFPAGFSSLRKSNPYITNELVLRDILRCATFLRRQQNWLFDGLRTITYGKAYFQIRLLENNLQVMRYLNCLELEK